VKKVGRSYAVDNDRFVYGNFDIDVITGFDFVEAVFILLFKKSSQLLHFMGP